MPFQIGSVAVHDDGQHIGSAKRDTNNGIAGLSATGAILAPGNTLYLLRDGVNQIYLYERTSAEMVLKILRTGVNSYAANIRENNLDKRIQTESMKDAASGIAGLDANTLLALTQQRLNFKIGSFTRDTSLASGTQAINNIGFTPRLVLFFAKSNHAGEMSIGLDDGTTHLCIADQYATAAGTWGAVTLTIYLDEGGGKNYVGYISSLDADGFTIDWTKNGLPTGSATINYLAIR